jgi:hypothetical protein
MCAIQPIEFLNQHVLVMDDAYYYFQVARNVSLQGWATFDGVHATSGVQLLWALVLSGVALLWSERMAFLHATLVLCVLLNVVAGVTIWQVGRKFYSTTVGDLALWLWSGFMVGLWPTMIGMEYSLHVLIIVAIIGCWWEVRLDPTRATRLRLFWLGVLLTLNYWVRLDSALFSLLIWCNIVFSLRHTYSSQSTYLNHIIVFSSIPLLGGIGYAATCYLLTGTLVPISGTVKAHYASHHFDAFNGLTSLAGHLLWWVRIESRAMLDPISSALLAHHQSLWRPLPLAVLAGVLGTTWWGVHRIVCDRADDLRRLRLAAFLGVLWIFNALHVALVVATIGHFSHVTQHYYGWLLITWCFGIAALTETFLSWIGSPNIQRVVIASGLVGFLAMNSWIAAKRFLDGSTSYLHNRRLPVITWINEHIPVYARIGAWNAGQLGYFSDRTVVNLDGLANDRAFLSHLKSGAPILDYLEKEGITYLVDVDTPDLTMPYRASWDHRLWFRDSLPWSALDILYVEENHTEPVVVVRLRDNPIFASEERKSVSSD